MIRVERVLPNQRMKLTRWGGHFGWYKSSLIVAAPSRSHKISIVTTYNAGKRVFFGILAPMLFLSAANLIADFSKDQRSADSLDSLIYAAGACVLAIVAVKIAITGTSWGWFEGVGTLPWAKRLAFWLLLVLASISLVWYASRHL